MCSAMAIAQSFPERSINPYRRSCMFIFVLLEIPKVEPLILAAFVEIETCSSNLQLSIAIMEVRIFVVDAIGVPRKSIFFI